MHGSLHAENELSACRPPCCSAAPQTAPGYIYSAPEQDEEDETCTDPCADYYQQPQNYYQASIQQPSVRAYNQNNNLSYPQQSSVNWLTTPSVGQYKKPQCGPQQEGYTVNFEDIAITQLIQYISKISGTNFIYDRADLVVPQTGQPFQVTLVSEDPTQVADLSAALIQILKMHNLSVIEEGNNVIIFPDKIASRVSTVITDENIDEACDAVVITRVFKLNCVNALEMARIVKTLLSAEAIVEPAMETNHLIVTDITTNVNRITDLLAVLDTPNLALDVAEYSVQHADAGALADYAREILTPLNPPSSDIPFTLTAEPISGKIFIVANPCLIPRALQILKSLDIPEMASLQPPPGTLPEYGINGMPAGNEQLYMYKLKYQDGAEIAAALHDIGSNLSYNGVGNIEFVNTLYTVEWLEVNNSIIITGTPDSIQKVVSLLNELDQQPKQVYIEVLVLDTMLANSLDFGVQWVALGDEQNKLAFASGLLAQPGSAPNLYAGALNVATTGTPPPATPNPSEVPLATPGLLNGVVTSNFTEAFSLGIVGNIITHNGQSFLTLGALISALDEESDMKVVINPKIMVEDNQPANFFVGQNIPYQTTSTVIQQTGSVTQNIQYEDIGVELQVTPTISPNNIVTLQINQTVATLATAIGNLTPTTNKELVTTRVHVPDGTFLVMSGHVMDQCTYIRSGIPCLGTLPLIGPTFSRTIEQRQKRNLIFFIRPKVVTNIEEGIILTNEEGYQHNWDSNPCSLIEEGCQRAPECETYPNPCWPPRVQYGCPPPYPNYGPSAPSKPEANVPQYAPQKYFDIYPAENYQAPPPSTYYEAPPAYYDLNSPPQYGMYHAPYEANVSPPNPYYEMQQPPPYNPSQPSYYDPYTQSPYYAPPPSNYYDVDQSPYYAPPEPLNAYQEYIPHYGPTPGGE